MTNIVAEYEALAQVLSYLVNMDMTKEVVEIRSDNKMLVKQMKGEWKVRRGAYVPYYEKVKPLASKFSRISYVWIRREFNEEADALTHRAYEEYLAKKSSAR